MVAVFADPEHVEDVADEFPRVSVAAYNGPNTVLSGPAEDLEQLVATCSDDGIRCSWLDTSHAFHSELLEPALTEFESYAAQFEFAAPVAAADLQPRRRRAHGSDPAERTVLAAACPPAGAVRRERARRRRAGLLGTDGDRPAADSERGRTARLAGTLDPAARRSHRRARASDARRQMTEAVAAAYVAGHRPNFAALQHAPRRRLELPTYPFQHRSYWPKTAGIRSDGVAVSGILGAATDLASGDTVYTSRLSVKSQPWLADHVIYGTVVVPGATYAAMVLAAVEPPAQVQDVFFYEPILLGDKDSRELQLTLHPSDDGQGWTFQVSSRPYGDRESDWSLNAGGTVRAGVEDDSASDHADPIDVTLERLTRARPQQLFDAFVDNELALGPVWRSSLKSLWVGDREAVGDIMVGDDLAEHVGREPVHPVLLDLCTGIAGAALFAVASETDLDSDLFLPLRYGQVVLRERMPRRFYCRARWQPSGVDSEVQVFDLDFVDRDGGNLGGIQRVHGQTRTAGGVVAESRWRCDADVVQHRLAGAPASRIGRSRERERELAGRQFRRAGGRTAEFRCGRHRSPIPSSGGNSSRGLRKTARPISGIVLRAIGRPDAEESGTEFAARLEAEIGNVLDAVHAMLAQEGTSLAGGLWLITERAVATEAGEPVDPVQAALWGLGRTDHRRAADAAVQAGRRRWIRRCRRASWRTCSVRPATSRNWHCDKGSCWCRGYCHGREAATCGPAYVRLRPGTDRTWRDRQPAGDRNGADAADRRPRAGPGGGRGRQLPRRAQRTRPLPGRSWAGRRRLRRHRHGSGSGRHRIRSRATGLRRVAGRDGQPGQRARPTARAGTRSDQRDSGGEHTNGDAHGAAGVRLGEAGRR